MVEHIKQVLKTELERRLHEKGIVHHIRDLGKRIDFRIAHKKLTYQVTITQVTLASGTEVPAVFFRHENERGVSIFDKNYVVEREEKISHFLSEWESDCQELHMMNVFSEKNYQGIQKVITNLHSIGEGENWRIFLEAFKRKMEVETDEELEVRLPFVQISKNYRRDGYVVVMLNQRIECYKQKNEAGLIEYEWE